MTAGESSGFVAWYGPVFWPYAFDDAFLYTFWPSDYSGYDGPFWAYAYTEVVDGAFRAPWDLLTGAAEAASKAPPRQGLQRGVRSRFGARGLEGQSREFAEICGRRPPGSADWPLERIARTVQPTAAQSAALRDLGAAITETADRLYASCPTELAIMPTSRMETVRRRLDAFIAAIAAVRPRTATFWDLLSPEQKARLDAEEGEAAATVRSAEPSSEPNRPDPAPLPICGDLVTEAGRRSLEWIDGIVGADERQRELLSNLREARGKAMQVLRSACAGQRPRTPSERLDALAHRLEAMREAAAAEGAALDALYATLSGPQRASLSSMADRVARP